MPVGIVGWTRQWDRNWGQGSIHSERSDIKKFLFSALLKCSVLSPTCFRISFCTFHRKLAAAFSIYCYLICEGKAVPRGAKTSPKKGVCLGTFTSKTLFPDGFLCFYRNVSHLFNLLINIECIQCFPNENKSQEIQFCWLGQ